VVLLALLCFFLLPCYAELENAIWLVVAGTSKTIAPVVKAKKTLGSLKNDSSIITTSDCVNAKENLFLLTISMNKSKILAQAVLLNLRKYIKDAYLFECLVKPDSRLALGVPFIDPTIETMPDNIVNWSDDDKVAELKKIRNNEYLILKKIYNKNDQSVYEGRTVQLYVFNRIAKTYRLLTENCLDFGGFDVKNNLLAFHCAYMQSDIHIIHEVQAYQLNSFKKIGAKTYCRNPIILKNYQLSCQQESVNPQGELTLKKSLFTLKQ
jgi:hypothetical protein